MSVAHSRSLRCLTLAVLALAGAPGPSRAQDGVAAARRSSVARVIPLPEQDVFHPLIADPKQPQFRASYVATVAGVRLTRVAAVAFGENFGLVRWATRDTLQGWQLNLAGAVFAQFDLETESFDLMNADYVIGIPLTYRRGTTSARVRVYHQSSHLGDEYLLRTDVERINIQWESIEAIVAREVGPLRAYAGGEYMFHREPSTLRAGALHGGLEHHHRPPVVRLGGLAQGRFVAAVDVRSWQEHGWRPGVSVKTGLEFGPVREREHEGRRWSILAEYYDGPSPYGQFHSYDVTYLGAGLYFMF